MAESLRGQVAIVTGGSRGIGLALATALAAEGMAVALVARSRETVEAAAGTFSPREPARLLSRQT